MLRLIAVLAALATLGAPSARAQAGLSCINSLSEVRGTVVRAERAHPGGTALSGLVLRLPVYTCAKVAWVGTQTLQVRDIHLASADEALLRQLSGKLGAEVTVRLADLVLPNTGWHLGDAVTTRFTLVGDEAPPNRVARAVDQLGPSFECGAKLVATQPLAQMICRNRTLAYAELSYVIAYRALRDTSTLAVRRTLIDDANALVVAINEQCNIAQIGSLSAEPTEADVQCVKGRFDRQRLELISRMAGAGREEGVLEPTEIAAIQRGLQAKSYLPQTAGIDGVLGPMSRQAILAWQKDNGLPETGFGSRAMIAALTGRLPSPAAASPPAPPPAPAAPSALAAVPASAAAPALAMVTAPEAVPAPATASAPAAPPVMATVTATAAVPAPATAAPPAASTNPAVAPAPAPPMFLVDRAGRTSSIRLALADGREQRAQDVFESVSPAVYVVKTPEALGSAVAVSDRELLTNCHIMKDASALTLERDGVKLLAGLVSADREADRCVLRIAESAAALPKWVRIRPYVDVKVGERVYTVGAPQGLELSLAEGIVSSKRTIDGGRFIQTSAPMSSGSSGGGLFDAYGHLVGITTSILKNSQNLNFAIPAEEYAR